MIPGQHKTLTDARRAALDRQIHNHTNRAYTRPDTADREGRRGPEPRHE